MEHGKLHIIQDSREQTPWRFSESAQVTVATLAAGDYSLAGAEEEIAIERKSLADFLGSITFGRERFKRELRLLRSYRFAALFIEARFEDILTKAYPNDIHPNAVLGTIAAFAYRYRVMPVLAGDAGTAADLAERMLWAIARDAKRAMALFGGEE